jgi:hydroxypyruvate reductase
VILPDSLLPIIQAAVSGFARYPKLQQELRKVQEPLHILAIGKAAYQMAQVAFQALGEKRLRSCIVLTKYGFVPQESPPDFHPEILEAGHPVPDQNSLLNSRYILEHLRSIPRDESLIVLLSGGSSSLFEIPRKPHNLEDIIALNRMLLTSGLDIRQINLKRQEYSLTKGGGAANCFSGKDLRVYLLSDVPGDDPAIIGSGPFYQEHIPQIIIGKNQALVRLVARSLRASYPDLPIRISKRFVDDDAARFARALARYARLAPKGIYLFGGECSIRPRGSGLGGRLSHLALEFATAVQTDRKISLVALASDGNDNLPQSAGAIADQDSIIKMRDCHVDPQAALRNFDSYSALDKAGLIIPGYYSGCNANDIIALFVD